MIADILARILDWKRDEVARAKGKVPLRELRQQMRDMSPSRSFWDALQDGGTRIIAEIKKASPSAGMIREDFDPVAIGRLYESHGAAAISVLTDYHFFQGELAFLQSVREQVQIPLLRKDFIISAYQLYEARLHGADAALLIAAALDVSQLKDLATLCVELGLEPLVEVHTAAELEKALQCSSRLLGINNRDLHTFTTDVATTLDLLSQIPPGYRVVSESGLRDRETITHLESHGVDAFLVGESLMRESDIGAKLDELRGSCRR